MDGFKQLPKMKAFKEGGHVAKEYCGGGMAKKKAGGEVEKKDLAQDKAMIKKAFKQHDEAEHDKDNADEIKLRRGGRAKKEGGTVKKFKKDGGAVYGAKKSSEDLKDIKEAKDFKPKKLKEGGSSDVVKEKSKPAGNKDSLKKVAPTGNKKAEAPSKGEKRSALRGSDVEKEKSKPAGDKVGLAKVKPTGDKKAAAPSKGEKRPAMKGSDVRKFADGGDTNTDDNVGADGIFSRPDYSMYKDLPEAVVIPGEAKAPSAAAKKAPIVTMKQLKDSGFDNLRDYLNAQQGLTRRGSPASAPKAAPKAAPVSDFDEGAGDGWGNAASRPEEEPGLEGVHPELAFLGGAAGMGMKGIASLAARLAGRGAVRSAAPAAAEAVPALANNPTRLLSGPSKADLLGAQRAARAAGRNADMLSENAARSGVTPGTPAAQAMAEQMRRLPAPDRSAVMNRQAWAAGPGAGMGLKEGGTPHFYGGGNVGNLATPQAVNEPAPVGARQVMPQQPQPQVGGTIATPQMVNEPVGGGAQARILADLLRRQQMQQGR
jgi:hypothetical protein